MKVTKDISRSATHFFLQSQDPNRSEKICGDPQKFAAYVIRQYVLKCSNLSIHECMNLPTAYYDVFLLHSSYETYEECERKAVIGK
jgi:hypothetical protein